MNALQQRTALVTMAALWSMAALVAGFARCVVGVPAAPLLCSQRDALRPMNALQQRTALVTMAALWSMAALVLLWLLLLHCLVRSTLLYFRLHAATYVLGGGVPTLYGFGVFRANFEVANQDGRVTPGEFPPSISPILDPSASF